MNARWIVITGIALAAAACGADTSEDQAAGQPTETAEQPAGTVEQPVRGAATQDPQTAPTTPETAAATEPTPGNTSAETAAAAMEEPAVEREYGELYTVQIASYMTPDKAEALAAQLRGRGLPIWTVAAQVEGRDWTRVRIGALPDLGEARELGRWIIRSYNSPVWVAPVDEDSEPVPAGAVDETRRFMLKL